MIRLFLWTLLVICTRLLWMDGLLYRLVRIVSRSCFGTTMSMAIRVVWSIWCGGWFPECASF